jgi:flagellar hook assembly protein FlgD
MPNPTKAATTLMYALGRDQPVTLTIHDVRGRVIRSLVEEAQSPGAHTVQWDGRDESGKPVPPSVYYARLSCEEGTRTTRIAVIR